MNTTVQELRDFDPAEFRRILGYFPTSVVVITAIDAGKPVGITIGSFTSVSVSPPLIGFFADKSSTSWPRIHRAGVFTVNLLGDHQADVSRVFASCNDKFAGIGWSPSPNGSPALDDATAWIACHIYHVAHAGDHWLVLGRVQTLAAADHERPLLFFQGRYSGLRKG